MSFALRDHAVLPATRRKRTQPVLTPDRDLPTSDWWKAVLT